MFYPGYSERFWYDITRKEELPIKSPDISSLFVSGWFLIVRTTDYFMSNWMIKNPLSKNVCLASDGNFFFLSSYPSNYYYPLLCRCSGCSLRSDYIVFFGGFHKKPDAIRNKPINRILRHIFIGGKFIYIDPIKTEFKVFLLLVGGFHFQRCWR